jgi:hypothetical protein
MEYIAAVVTLAFGVTAEPCYYEDGWQDVGVKEFHQSSHRPSR